MSVGATKTIPECEVLSVVVVEEKMVVYMVNSTVDQEYEGAGDTVVSVMYGDGPDIDKDEQ